MQVTGWTEWGNEDYINVNWEWRKIYVSSQSALRDKLEYKEFCNKCRNREVSEKEIEDYFANYDKKSQEVLDSCQEEYAKLNLPAEAELEDAVIKEVRSKGYKFTGDCHQNYEYGAPIIDNKYIYSVSQRQWGSIIAQAYPDEIDDSEGYGYLKWAWIVPEGEENIVPKGERG